MRVKPVLSSFFFIYFRLAEDSIYLALIEKV